MIGVQDLRPGTTFQMDGEPFVVLKYEHIKMGRGSATIKVKVKSLRNGAVVEKGFINNARVEEAIVDRRELQYLYKDDSTFYFMDPNTFEQLEVSSDFVDSQAPYLTEGGKVIIRLYEGKAIGLELPLKMTFKVAECDPGVKGDTATNLYKSATLENGLTVRVPLFINEGQAIVVDTRTGDYVERAKN
jgi:elongation factor P